MSITMSADAHTQLTNHINELGREVRELKKQNKELQEALDFHILEIGEKVTENEKLKEENKEAEDNLDEEMLKNEKLEVEIKKLKEPKKKTIIKNKKKKPDQTPKLIKVTDEEEVEAIRKKGGGSLMFPSQYRKLDNGDIHWKDIRKKYDLKGRWEAYCLTEFGESLPKQNKEVKYIHPHFVSQDWEGAYNGGVETWNRWVTDYVYGDVLLVKL